MARLAELARPPAHRGPLIAAGAVVLAVGVALMQLRLDDLGRGWHTLIAGAVALLVLWLAFQERPLGGPPSGHMSVLLVTGLLLLYLALLRLADLFDDFEDEFPAGSFVWTSLVEAGVAFYAAARRGSAACVLIGAAAVGIAFLSAIRWIFDADSLTTYRWMLLLLALGYAVASLVVRGSRPRESELLVSLAGLAVLSIGLTAAFVATFGAFFGPQEALLGDGWELVLAVAGFGLVAYAAADRAPGPAYLGLANLLVFAGLVGSDGDTLEWWPAVLLVLGAAVLLAGLRPRRPLPPEPAAYTAGDVPLAARSADDDVIVRVERE